MKTLKNISTVAVFLLLCFCTKAFAQSYTITFINYKALTEATQTTNYQGHLTTMPTVSTQAGFVFEGWFTKLEGGDSVSTSYTFSADTRVFARWSNASYIVVYDPGDFPASKQYYDFPTDVDTVNYNATFELPTLIPSAESPITFRGWGFGEDTTIYACSSLVSMANVKKYAQEDTLTVLARWDCATYREMIITAGNTTISEGLVEFDLADDTASRTVTFGFPDEENRYWYSRNGVDETERDSIIRSKMKTDIIMLVDVSGSMDYTLGGSSTAGNGEISRLEAAKDAINSMIDLMVENESDTRLSVITFSYNPNSYDRWNNPTSSINLTTGAYTTVISPVAVTSANQSSLKNTVNGINADGGTASDIALYGAKKGVQSIVNVAGYDREPYVIFFTDGVPGDNGEFDCSTSYVYYNNSGRLAAEAANQAAIIKGTRGASVTTNVPITYDNRTYYGVAASSYQSNTDWVNGSWDRGSRYNSYGNYSRTETGLGGTVYTIGLFGSDYTGVTKSGIDAFFNAVASPGCNVGNIEPEAMGGIFSEVFTTIETTLYKKLAGFEYLQTGPSLTNTYDNCGMFQVAAALDDACGNFVVSDTITVVVSDGSLEPVELTMYCPKDGGVPVLPFVENQNENIDSVVYHWGTNSVVSRTGNGIFACDKVVVLPYQTVNVNYYVPSGVASLQGCPSKTYRVHLSKTTQPYAYDAVEAGGVYNPPMGFTPIMEGSCLVDTTGGLYYILVGANTSDEPFNLDSAYTDTNLYSGIRNGAAFNLGIQTNATEVWGTVEAASHVMPVGTFTYGGKTLPMIDRSFSLGLTSPRLDHTVTVVIPITQNEIDKLWWYCGSGATPASLGVYAAKGGFTPMGQPTGTFDATCYNITSFTTQTDDNNKVMYLATANVPDPATVLGTPQSAGQKSNTNVRYFVGIDDAFLPVDLISFTADCLGGSVLLKWSTASETNNEYFILERSTDAVNYTEVARINGAGTTASQNDYSFQTENTVSEVMYYRLRQIDFNGQSEAFAPVAVQCQSTLSSLEVNVYPSPASTNIHIATNDVEMSKVELFNVHGAKVKEQAADYSTLQMNIADLPSGVYTLKITTINGTIVNKRVIKK